MAENLTNLGSELAETGETAFNNVWLDKLNAALQDIDDELLTRTFAQNFADFILSRAKLKDTCEVVQTVAAASTTTINIEDGNIVNLTQDTNISTLTISNWPPTGNRGYLVIKRTKDATGTARTITWPTISWKGGDTEPTLTQTTGAVDEILLWSDDAGTTIYGMFTAQ